MSRVIISIERDDAVEVAAALRLAQPRPIAEACQRVGHAIQAALGPDHRFRFEKKGPICRTTDGIIRVVAVEYEITDDPPSDITVTGLTDRGMTGLQAAVAHTARHAEFWRQP